MASPRPRGSLFLCEFGCGFCGTYSTVAEHESRCAKGIEALDRGIGSLDSGPRGRSRSRSRSPRGVNTTRLQVGDAVTVFHSASPGNGTWPAHDNPYRRRFDAMRKRYSWDEDLPADGTTGFVEAIYDEWGHRGCVIRVAGARCVYVNLDGVVRTADFQADMGRLEELERTALEHPEKEVRLEAGVEADAIRSQYELEPLLMQSYYAEKQKFFLLQGLEETARNDARYTSAAHYWQGQRESAEKMCATLSELSANAMRRGESSGAAANFAEAVGLLNGVLERGQDLVRDYRVANGEPLDSDSTASSVSREGCPRGPSCELDVDSDLSDTAPDALPPLLFDDGPDLD